MAQIYADLKEVPEDDRILVIGRSVLALPPGRMGAFLVEDDTVEPGKADRYVKKLAEKFPQIEVVDRFPHPQVAKVTVVRVRLLANAS